MLNIFLSGFSSLTVTSRVGYAMARDRAFPCSDYLSKINPETKSPDNIIMLVFLLASCLCCLPMISTTAFTAITSIATIGVQASYALPIFLRVTHSSKSFKNNGFSLGRFSIILGWISFIWLMITSTVLILPSRRDPLLGINAENFNYTSVVIVFTLLFIVVNWNLPKPYGVKHFFKGPKLA